MYIYTYTHIHKYIHRERTKQKSKRLIILTRVNVEIINKILANQTQECMKTIYHDHGGFIPEMQDWYHTSNEY